MTHVDSLTASDTSRPNYESQVCTETLLPFLRLDGHPDVPYHTVSGEYEPVCGFPPTPSSVPLELEVFLDYYAPKEITSKLIACKTPFKLKRDAVQVNPSPARTASPRPANHPQGDYRKIFPVHIMALLAEGPWNSPSTPPAESWAARGNSLLSREQLTSRDLFIFRTLLRINNENRSHFYYLALRARQVPARHGNVWVEPQQAKV